MPIACRWNVESPVCLDTPTIAELTIASDDTAKNPSTAPQLKSRPCQVSSPRQKLAIKLDQKTQRPCGVKIGCPHQSANALRVQPSNMIFSAEPVASPKCDLVQTNQIPIRIAAQ